MPTTEERLVSSLLGVMRSLEKPLSRHVSAQGLTVAQFAVLETLYHKGERTVNDIIADIFSSSGNISVVIDNLIKADLLQKKVNPNDGRSRLIGLTPAGRAKIAAYYPHHKDELQRIFTGMDEEEKEACIQLLMSLRRCIATNNQSE